MSKLKVNNLEPLSGNIVSIASDLAVDGTLTAKVLRTELTQSAILYESGSSKFGDTYDDLHQFTGSIQLDGFTEIKGNDNKIKVGLIGNLNKLEIDKIHNGDLNEFTFFGPFSQAYLEAAAPDYKFGLNLGYSTSKFNALVSLTQFSEVILQDFQWVDSPATTQAEADALYEVATDVYKAAMTVDLSLGYEFSKSLKLTLGANNLFNIYPTPQFDGWTDQGGLTDSVQMGSDGAYFFGRISFNL